MFDKKNVSLVYTLSDFKKIVFYAPASVDWAET